ncbi:hypothetical protein N658DRAFT_430999 [Parathielavia hyrcaniae]|uniref:Uncharacterized protein n=1 Tax=Parathielavia hyrcaniae TaxID=113614 RepID=A0AAN6PW32_9PEZI|nr:hypothetical protein N658DRAFT_430999 [Parathielavia hyrcaniae]
MAPQPNQPTIHLISKSDFTTHHLVPVPVTVSPESPNPPPLRPGQARIRTHTIALTTNNLTYAKLGGMPGLGWWDVWPMPPAASLPAPFNQPSALAAYCRVLAWGYSAVVESAVPGLDEGTLLFGTQPVGSLDEVVELERIASTEEDGLGEWREVSERRKQLNGAMGWDSLMSVLFQSGYMLNRFVFAWEDRVEPVHPLGHPALPWTREDADLAGAVVVVLAASGKTGLAFASEVRARRPAEKQPAKMVAVGSGKSREFTAGTGLFDEVLLYSDLEDQGFDLEGTLGVGVGRKVLVMDFGARGDAVDRWATALRAKAGKMQVLVVGGDPLGKEFTETAKQTQVPESGVTQFFAGGVRDRAIEVGAPLKYFSVQEAETAWEEFKAAGAISGVQLKWGEGLASFSEDWDELAKGGYGPHIGLVYRFV